MLKKITPYLLFLIYKLIQITWRIRIHESSEVQCFIKNNESFILAHWHGDELGILHLLKKYHVACIISTSKDGDLMARAVTLLGGETVRGSSTRGGANAVKGMLRLRAKGRRPSVAVDGPKGPIYQVKPGVFQISKLTQLPIVPISFHSTNSFVFKKSWNQSALPLPFSSVTIYLAPPMLAIEKTADPKSDLLALTLKKQIHATQKMAHDLAKETRAIY